MYLAGKNNKMNKPDSRTRKTKNDNVRTNPLFAKKIIDYFAPQFQPGDILLDPCRGDGAFFENYPDGYQKAWCEIADGRDFLEYEKDAQWIITNMPWSGKIIRPMIRHSCSISDNVVHLIRVHNILGTTARHHDFLDQHHKIKEIIICPSWKDAFINKSPEGFALMVIHTKKKYTGDCRWTYWT